jgi:hypothetical protein
MQPIWANMAVLVVALLYYVWRAHLQAKQARERVLRERVTYMLWVMAAGREEWEPSLASEG